MNYDELLKSYGWSFVKGCGCGGAKYKKGEYSVKINSGFKLFKNKQQINSGKLTELENAIKDL